MDPKRRSLLSLLLLTCWFATAGNVAVRDASAKDGGSNSGSGSSGSGSSGSGSSGSNSGSGSDDSGHGGSDDSGHGGGDDNGGGHGSDDGDDDNGSDDSNNRGSTGSQGRGSDYDRARDAVRDGKVLPLKAILKNIDMRRYGRVIDVRLKRSMFSDTYQLKVRDGAGTIRTLRINARNGTLLGGS
jgi:hypothetical protein